MSRHPDRGDLRRMLDEPQEVPADVRSHVEACATCSAEREALAAQAAAAQAALSVPRADAADPLPALRTLRANEPTRVPPKPGFAEALRGRLALQSRRVLRVGSVLGLVAALMAGLVATGAAGNLIKIFQPETFAPVTFDLTSLTSLPHLSGFGSVNSLKAPSVTETASAATAEADSGLHLLSWGTLPPSVKGTPNYIVITQGQGSFTFNAATASGTAGQLGRTLPALPADLNGSTLTLQAGPGVVEIVGSLDLGSLGFGSESTSVSGTAGGGRLGQLSGLLGNLPEAMVVQMKAPALYSDGPSVAEYERALLSLPGMPPALAAQIKALGSPSSTLPIPIPTSLAESSSVDINGSPGLLIGDSTGIASAVIWQSHGLVCAVVGALSDSAVVAIARSMH
ncbi:MAG TPA: hypothetical protein VFW71_04765 [Actinomycetota bacterium]|nr:hypothetical protein [Actinomycetota bacterium]